MTLPPPSHREIVLYSREGCHLCEIAERVIRPELESRGLPLRIADIDSDPSLVAAYGHDIPVVTLGGEVVFKHHVNAAALRACLDRKS